MSTVPLSVLITRQTVPGGPLADLQLNDKTNFSVVTFGPGQRRWARDMATAPSSHGGTQVSARMDIQTAPLRVRALGSTTTALKANAVKMVNAFAQLTFTLKITWDTNWYEEWRCMAADGGTDTGDSSFDPALLLAHQQVYAWAVPRQPVPTSGVL